MRQIVSTVCTLVLLAFGHGLAQADVSHSCTFTLSDWSRQVEEVTGILLTTHTYPDMRIATAAGEPMLPCRRVTLAVPYNATGFTVTVTDSTATDTLEAFTVKPTPQPVARDGSADEEPPVFDQSVYGSDALFPASPVLVAGDGYYRGEFHQLALDVYPMRYNPVSGLLRHYTSLTFTVSWTTSEAAGRRAIVRGDRQARQADLAEAAGMVANAGDVAAFAPSATMLRSPVDTAAVYGGELYRTSSNYTIITTDAFAHPLRRLAALKRQKGYSVTVKTVDEILADSAVSDGDKCALADGTYTYINDDAGKLRQYLRNAFKNGDTDYVLMAGKDVPFRYALSHDKIRATIPTDLYYSDLTSNWNINGDDVYGESTQYDTVNRFDANPELYVGRLMFENVGDVDNYLSKLFRYELNPGNGDTQYLGRATETVFTEFHDGQAVTSEISNVFSQAKLIHLGATENNPTAKELIDTINTDNFGFVFLETHGLPNLVGIKYEQVGRNHKIINSIYSASNECESLIDASLSDICNKHQPSILYTAACLNIPFDVWTGANLHNNLESFSNRNFGQSFTLGKDYGGPALIGYTREAFGFKETEGATLLMREFIAQIDSGRLNIGKAVALSKMNFGNPLDFNVFSNNLMGDPELRVWTSSLTPFSGVTVNRYNNGITVSGIDVSGAKPIVSLCGNTGQRMSGIGYSSVTFSNVDPNSMVMIRADGKLPYIAPLVLQNTTITNSQYVIAGDVVAGSNVDSNRTAGDVTIAAGVEYEIEHKGSVTLGPGFTVEKGATFTVTPSDY